MPKIIQYRDDCIGCNSCVEYAPGYWEMQSDGKSIPRGSCEKKGVYQRSLTEYELDENILAARHCPVNIIRVLNDSGQEL